MAKRGKHFSSEFKFKVVLETLREESTLAMLLEGQTLSQNPLYLLVLK